VVDTFRQLAATIGLAFFALSTVSLVTQSWLAHSDLPEQGNPYRLYALSNAGSFLGLLSYPFFIEYRFALGEQLLIWRIGYFLLVALYLLSLAAVGVADRTIQGFPPARWTGVASRWRGGAPALRQRISWFLLAAAGCILFLSVTNVMTYEITPCPLLWIIPLCIYLLSFVLAFQKRPYQPRWLQTFFPTTLGLSVLLFFLSQTRQAFVFALLAALALSLFFLCLFCQQELYRSRPAEKGDLTSFYLWVAGGGLAGSFFVAWLAPMLFQTPSEYLAGLAAVALAVFLREGSGRLRFSHWRLMAYLVLLLFLWPLAFTGPTLLGIAVAGLSLSAIFHRLGRHPGALCLALLVVMLLSPWAAPRWNSDGPVVYAYRNYYGIYRIQHQGGVARLYHGTTLHGAQYLGGDPARRLEPLTYYHRHTLVGKVLDSGLFPAERIGIVGLGTGTLSSYGKTGETLDFFELDPDQGQIAAVFSYVRHARASLSFTYQDARLALQSAPPGNYDLLIIDAFSGDSVPFHLLTLEALGEYHRHLKPGGLLLLHISNQYLDLAPVLFSNARILKAAVVNHVNPQEGPLRLAASWVAITWNGDTFGRLVGLLRGEAPLERAPEKPVAAPAKASGAPSPAPSLSHVRPWTDDYSSILTVLDGEAFRKPLQRLNPFSR
jgi:SAM-dependent methyltransferase